MRLARAAFAAARSLAAAVLAATALPALAADAAADAAPLTMQQPAPGIHVHFGQQQDWLKSNGGDIANIGFIVGERCVAVIDTGGSPAIGRRLKAAVAAATPLPVCYVVDTHAHVDHVLGNAAFADGKAVFVASARYAASLDARERYIANAFERDFGERLAPADFVQPGLTVNPGHPVELDLGGRVLRLQAWPTAHTDNDLTVYDTTTRTLLLGDLLFVGHLPVVDGKLRGWLAVMDELRRLPDVALAVPGHGPASSDWPAALDAQQRYLQALLQETRAAIKSRMTIQQAVETVGRDATAGWLLVEAFHKRNVTAAYAELEWED